VRIPGNGRRRPAPRAARTSLPDHRRAWDDAGYQWLVELQELGAWKSETMVKRYAHFAPEQLRRAADRDLLRFVMQKKNRLQR